MALAKATGHGNFYCQINGEAGGYLESFTAPTIEIQKIEANNGPDFQVKYGGGRVQFGKIKLVTNISEANALWELIDSVMKKNCREFEAVFGVADQNYKSIREVDMIGCLMESVSFSALDAKEAKSLMKVTCEFVASNVKYRNGTGTVIKGNLSSKAKGWQVPYFDAIGVPGGIPPQCISKIDLPKHTVKIIDEHHGQFRLPTRNFGAYKCEGLKITGSYASGGFEAARDYAVKLMYDGVLQESEFMDWSVNVKDPSHKNVIGEFSFIQTACSKFSMGEAKGNGDLAQWDMEFMCEESYCKINQKA